MIRILRVRKKETMIRPENVGLVHRAVEASRFPGLSWPVLLAELVRRIDEPGLAVYLAQDNDVPKALAVVILPASAMMVAPQAPLLYNEGRPAVMRALKRVVKAWLQGEGYDRIWGINLRHDDRVVERGFRDLGTPTRIGTVMEFRF